MEFTYPTDDDGLVRYDDHVPSKGLVNFGILVGWLLNFVGVAALLIWIDQANNYPSYRRGNGYGEYAPSEMWPMGIEIQHYHWIGLLIAGVTILIFAYRFRFAHHREVLQGQVIDKDVIGGGNSPIEHMLLVEGYTRSNELRRQWHSVSLGTLEEYDKGDLIDFRQ